MTKTRTTRKAIVSSCKKIRKAGYCELQHLLKIVAPVGYTCGMYGWNFDVYEINGLTICTGYRGMPGSPLKEAIEYEQKAIDLWNSNESYDAKQELARNLLKEFCEKNGGN